MLMFTNLCIIVYYNRNFIIDQNNHYDFCHNRPALAQRVWSLLNTLSASHTAHRSETAEPITVKNNQAGSSGPLK